MWDRVELADIDRAKESLGHRLAETLARHAEETNSLRAKQADELHELEAKQADIETLATLIDRFAAEFQSTTLAYAAPAVYQGKAGAEVSPDGPADNQDDGAELATEAAAEGTPAVFSRPEKLALQYASPNFRAFRKLAS